MSEMEKLLGKIQQVIDNLPPWVRNERSALVGTTSMMVSARAMRRAWWSMFGRWLRFPADDEHRIYPSAHGAHLMLDDRHPIIHHSAAELQVLRRDLYNVPRTSIDLEDGA